MMPPAPHDPRSAPPASQEVGPQWTKEGFLTNSKLVVMEIVQGSGVPEVGSSDLKKLSEGCLYFEMGASASEQLWGTC